MLEYSGHPLVDVGAATILAFSGKRSLSSLNESEIDKIADFMSKEYVINPLQSFLTVAFPNSGFTQPAFKNQPEKRQEYTKRVTRSFHDEQPSIRERCVFTGKPATAIAFSDD
jgi:CRISPR-associated protein Cst1